MFSAMDFVRGLGYKVKAGGGEGKVEVTRDQCRALLLDLPKAPPVNIEFNNITLSVPGDKGKGKKTVLKSVSGCFNSGELTAIMGPSGAGKSSLLNTLTGFATHGTTGTIRVGGQECAVGAAGVRRDSVRAYRKQACYILQDDRLNPLFTVGEAMAMAADLKLGNTLAPKAKQMVIDDVLDTLGLSDTQFTRCGSLSGGQKKRLSIALELIDNPPVIFLDEPTTGLDSSSSSQCISMLSALARGGRTVVCTVHQPSASVYALFDHVYALADGRCIYQGSSANTVPYLSSVGLQCPKYHNPADYLLEVANCEYGNFNEVLSTVVKESSWRDSSSDIDVSEELQGESNPPPSRPRGVSLATTKTIILVSPPSEFSKFLVLLNRCIVQLYRDWTVTHLKMILHMLVGIILGLLFKKSGSDGSKILSNLGYFAVTAVYLCYTSMMPAILKYPQELPVLKKEYFNNWYKLRTYYAAVLVTNIPVQIMFSSVYCTSSYFLTDQPPEAMRFFMFVIICVLITLVAEAIGNVIGTCVNPVNGTFLGAVLTCTMLAFAGYLSLYPHMPRFMYYISYASYLRYAVEGLVLSMYGYNRATLECAGEEFYCHYRYPKRILNELDMTRGEYWFDAGILFANLIMLRILAFYTLSRNMTSKK